MGNLGKGMKETYTGGQILESGPSSKLSSRVASLQRLTK